MAEEMLRRNLDRAFDPGADFPDRLLLSRTMAMLDVPSTTERRLHWRQPQAVAAVATLLAIAIVATLLFAAHQRQTAPAKPGPYRATRTTPYTIPSPPPPAVSCSSVPRQWASSPPNPAKMLSATTGWAYGPMRTTDGGAHWLDVSPPSIPNRTNKNDEFFLDATHAWVAETASSSTSCVDHVVIFNTADGGKTWQKAAPIRVKLSDPTDSIWTGAANHASWFYFIDARNGWLLLGSGPKDLPNGVDSTWVGATWRIGDLYRTADGGLSWTLTATNLGAAGVCPPFSPLSLNQATMSFSSPSIGWMLSTCGLMATSDGGLSWNKSITKLVPNEVPVFFDQKHGLISAEGGLLVTSDGGASWSVRALPGGGAIVVEFISPSEGWAAGMGDNSLQCSLDNLVPCSHNFRLYHTSDGGKTWVPGNFTSLGMPATKFWPPAYLHFVDSKNGFSSTGEDSRESGLFRTADAGRTWTRVDGTVEGP